MELETHQSEWALLRNTVANASTDSDLDGTATPPTTTWSYFGTSLESISWEAKRKTNGVTIKFDTKADNETATCTIYAYKVKGDAERVCEANLIGGACKTGDSTTRYHVDTIGDSTWTPTWYDTIKLVDAGGNDRIAKMSFDLCGYSHVLCLFTTIGSGHDVRAWISYW